jgi:putative transposase
LKSRLRVTDHRRVKPITLNTDKLYDTDLTDAAWALIGPMLPAARRGGRPRTTNIRAVLNAIFYLLRTGCQWRLLPREFPVWSMVYQYFRAWKNGGVWTCVQRSMYQQARRQAGRTACPSVVIMDGQSAISFQSSCSPSCPVPLPRGFHCLFHDIINNESLNCYYSKLLCLLNLSDRPQRFEGLSTARIRRDDGNYSIICVLPGCSWALQQAR